jgi:MFS family permease
MGFPRPHVDDPFFVGTATHLARTGDLYKPHIRLWLEPFTEGRFFVHFPIYPALLATWMKVAGIGTGSLLLFFACANFLTCLSAGWVVKKCGLPLGLLVLLPWLILTFAQWQGFRGDLPGLSLLAASAAFFTHPRPWAFFFAGLTGLLAMMVWPVLGGFFVPLASFAFYHHLQHELPKNKVLWLWKRLVGIALGFSVSLLWFLFLIQFNVELFFKDFLLAASMRRPEGARILETFVGLSWARFSHPYLISVWLTSLFLIYWTFRPPQDFSKACRYGLALAFCGSVLATILYAVNVHLIYLFFGIMFFMTLFEFIRIKRYQEITLLAVLSLGLWSQIFRALPSFLPRPPTDTSVIFKELEKYPNATIVFDEVAYRDIFNLSPPLSSLSWLGLHPAPRLGARPEDKQPDQIWVVSGYRWHSESQENEHEFIVIPPTLSPP